LLSTRKSLTYNPSPVAAIQSSTIMPNRPNIHTAQIKDVRFGENVTIVEPVNLYGCSIGDDAFVGPFVEIQADSKIGPKTRVQSHTFICEFVAIGSDCFIGHGVMFINDRFENGGPAPRDRSLLTPTKIGNQVSIGSNATILPVSICDRVVIGAGAVVTKDIDQPGTYAGNPARKLRDLD
jgi:acetyltransferase-like isoleucine patch superfamily enzyme